MVRSDHQCNTETYTPRLTRSEIRVLYLPCCPVGFMFTYLNTGGPKEVEVSPERTFFGHTFKFGGKTLSWYTNTTNYRPTTVQEDDHDKSHEERRKVRESTRLLSRTRGESLRSFRGKSHNPPETRWTDP